MICVRGRGAVGAKRAAQQDSENLGARGVNEGGSDMKINAKLTLLVGAHGARIEIHDDDANITLFSGEMSADSFLAALGRMSHVSFDSAELRGLDRVGKRHENKKHEFALGLNSGEWRKDERLAALRLLDDGTAGVPDGWVADRYFGSQGSFFEKDDIRWARCTIRRWIDKV